MFWEKFSHKEVNFYYGIVYIGALINIFLKNSIRYNLFIAHCSY